MAKLYAKKIFSILKELFIKFSQLLYDKIYKIVVI